MGAGPDPDGACLEANLRGSNGEVTAPGAGQTVGVIDTGIDQDHPAFCKGGSATCEKTISEDRSSGANDETGTESSHGTAVASVIVGRPSDTHTAECARAWRGAPMSRCSRSRPGRVAATISR